jgi:hypothetical protein
MQLSLVQIRQLRHCLLFYELARAQHQEALASAAPAIQTHTPAPLIRRPPTADRTRHAHTYDT